MQPSSYEQGGWLHFLYMQGWGMILFHGNLNSLTAYLGNDQRSGRDGLRSHAIYRFDRANMLAINGIEVNLLAIVKTRKRYDAIV